MVSVKQQFLNVWIIYNSWRWITRLPHRWRTQLKAIRYANCRACEKSNFWTQVALAGNPVSMSVWVSAKNISQLFCFIFFNGSKWWWLLGCYSIYCCIAWNSDLYCLHVSCDFFLQLIVCFIFYFAQYSCYTFPLWLWYLWVCVAMCFYPSMVCSIKINLFFILKSRLLTFYSTHEKRSWVWVLGIMEGFL